MTKFLGLILIVTLGVTVFLGLRVEAMKTQNEAMRADITQLQTDTDTKLKSMSAAVDTLSTKIAVLEQGQPHAAAAPEQAAPAAMTPPVVVSPQPAAPAPAAPVPAAVR